MDFEALKAALNSRFPGPIDGRAPCAVLVPLVEQGGEWCLLYEKRASTLKMQPGQVCFPGGHIEYGEPAVKCAIRETFEELNLPPEQIEVLGPLDYVIHYMGFPVYPFLARLKDGWAQQLRISEDEVESAFTIPLSWLRRTPPVEIPVTRANIAPEDTPEEYLSYVSVPPRREKLPLLFWRYEDKLLWGLTARITRWLLDYLEAEHGI